nr:hypothetical protein [Planctomycetales bacterium]
MVIPARSAPRQLTALATTLLLLSGCSHWGSPSAVEGIARGTWPLPPAEDRAAAVAAAPVNAHPGGHAFLDPRQSRPPQLVRGQDPSGPGYGG